MFSSEKNFKAHKIIGIDQIEIVDQSKWTMSTMILGKKEVTISVNNKTGEISFQIPKYKNGISITLTKNGNTYSGTYKTGIDSDKPEAAKVSGDITFNLSLDGGTFSGKPSGFANAEQWNLNKSE